MQPVVTNKAIINFLQKNYKSTGWVDGLKIKYRSLICPFTSLLQMVQPGDKVGDVGCGSGQFLLLVSEFAEPSYLYGIEISDRLIQNANELFAAHPKDSYHFSTYDGVNFPVALQDMDIIFLIDVLHHVPKKLQENFLKQLIETMKPGARLVLKDINGASPWVLCNKMHDMVFAGEIGNELSLSHAKNLIEANKMTITDQFKRTMYVYPHYCIIAKK